MSPEPRSEVRLVSAAVGVSSDGEPPEDVVTVRSREGTGHTALQVRSRRVMLRGHGRIAIALGRSFTCSLRYRSRHWSENTCYRSAQLSTQSDALILTALDNAQFEC